MSRPLELSYNWRAPVSFATIGLLICIGVLVRSTIVGRAGAVAAVIVLWAVFMAVVWGRTRALIEVVGDTLRVRRFLNIHELEGPRVTTVREYLTASGPSYKVRLTADQRTYYVPSAMLRQGQSTFLGWLLTNCPDAELDKGSLKTIDRLRTRGLIE